MESSFFAVINSLFVTFVLFLIYRLYPSNKTYWKKKGIPYVQSDIFSEIFPSTKEKPVQEVQIERQKYYGLIYGYFEKNLPVLSVSDPELLKAILVKDFKYLTSRRNEDNSLDAFQARMLNSSRYENWRRLRTIISPTFTAVKLKKLLPIFEDCSRTLVKNLRNASIEHCVEIIRYCQGFTLDVIASTSFSLKLDSINNPENRFVKEVEKLFKQCSWLKVFLFNIIARVFGPRSLKLLYVPKQLAFFEKISLQVVKERKRKGKDQNDFLQLLINASTDSEESAKNEDEEFNDIAQNYKAEMKKTNAAKKFLTDDEVVAQCGNFLLGGQHTNAMALVYSIYMMAVHQDVQDKVYREIQKALQENKNILDTESLHQMKYLDNVISETLRLYPPTPTLERIATTDYELGTTGITIFKGMKLTVPIYALHRNPQFFNRPDHFDPDRFGASNISQIEPYTYLPFGAGPRNCIAMRFGLLQLKVCLVHILSSFDLQTCCHTKIPLEFHNRRHIMPFVSLLPKDVKVRMVPRTENPLKNDV